MTPAGPLVLHEVGAELGGRIVLAGISAVLPPASLVAIVGPNGAGKTSLLRVIAGLLPHRGSIMQDGTDLARMPSRARARRVAYLPQASVAHWPLPARDIVALGRFPHGAGDPLAMKPADAEAVAAAMRTTHTSDLADRPVTEVSGGERARIALARVFAVGAPLILADEPTAALDPRHQIEIMTILRKTADDGALVLAVTHDLGLAARFCDRLLVLDAGRLAVADTPERALSPTILDRVFGVTHYHATHLGRPVLVPWSPTRP